MLCLTVRFTVLLKAKAPVRIIFAVKIHGRANPETPEPRKTHLLDIY